MCKIFIEETNGFKSLAYGIKKAFATEGF